MWEREREEGGEREEQKERIGYYILRYKFLTINPS